MRYLIVYPNELQHHGVKGMKWGVRKYQKSNGSLTKAGYEKYYTDGKLNRKGIQARKRAAAVRDFGNSGHTWRTLGYASLGLSAKVSYGGAKIMSGMLHQYGNITITKMKASGASYGKRKAVAGAYIAAMGAVKVATLAPYASAVYKDVRYRKSDKYRTRTDALADMSTYEKIQKNKKG